MRKVYLWLSVLLLAAVVVQFYFAGVGAFTRPEHDGSYRLHEITGMMVIPLLSLLATIAAAVARAPGRTIGLTILPLGLVVVQSLIVVLGDAISGGDESPTTRAGLVVLGLHAVNGLVIMGVAGTVLRRARLLASASATEQPTPAPSSAA